MPATLTNRTVLTRHNLSTDSIEHLDQEIKVLTTPQRQGDVLIIPCPDARKGKPIPKAGITVVRGETSGGNAHILHNLHGQCEWAPAPDGDENLLQGWLTVPEDAAATLIHTQEHGVLGVGPGCYEIRGQREMAGEWRRVSD
jgi:hypothetical protein